VTLSDDGENDLHGPFHWHKVANPAEALYPDGFSGEPELIGSRHSVPGTGARLLVVLDESPKALALFGNSDLNPLPGDSAFTLDAKNRALFPGDSGILMKTVPASGAFSGSFLDFSGTKVKRRSFGGVFLRRHDRAVGWYPGADESGAISLIPGDAGRLSMDTPATVEGTVSNALSFTPTVMNGPAVEWGISGDLPPGVTWSGVTHTLSGTPLAWGTWWITVWAEDATGNRSARRVHLSVDSLFAKTAGAYRGLATETTVAHASTALTQVTVTQAGAFSGVLTLGGKRYGFRGKFDPLTGDGGEVTIIRRGNTPLSLQLVMDQPGVGSTISGTLRADASLLTPAVDAAVLMKRLPWTRTNPTPTAGRYTVLLPRVLGSGLPQGHGYATMVVNSLGIVSMSGRSGDGALFTAGSGVSGDGDFPLVALVKRGAGSLSGWVMFEDLAGSDADGPLHWEDGGVVDGSVNFVASRFVRPPSGTRIIDGFGEDPGNGLMSIDDGFFDVEPDDWAFTLLSSNRVISADGSKKFGMAINVKTGAYSGFFPAVIGGKTVTIRHVGVAFQKLSASLGQFSLPDGTRGGIEWGADVPP
ncbi:MAG: hypothetical protein KDM63_05570, partial [Verrucomicrobiae bacterium]|nr:hypothetical protein [Verrucomicrobiae bacterium]